MAGLTLNELIRSLSDMRDAFDCGHVHVITFDRDTGCPVPVESLTLHHPYKGTWELELKTGMLDLEENARSACNAFWRHPPRHGYFNCAGRYIHPPTEEED